ncbi:molybdenum cofactor guanylyltransferase [Cohnella fermenti]|nr:molybdenum cofactor guanylyltransferase [Cohnella fermenti]
MGSLEGVILAGGAGRRMGGVAKGLLPFAGAPLIRTISERMASRCKTVALVVATQRQAQELGGLGLPTRLDWLPGSGPLSALHIALLEAQEPLVWVSACDMPFVSPHAADWMAERLEASGANAIVPRVSGRLHPLQAIYRPECVLHSQSCLAQEERRMMALLEAVKPCVAEEEELRRAGIDTSFVTNINTPDDYARIAPH